MDSPNQMDAENTSFSSNQAPEANLPGNQNSKVQVTLDVAPGDTIRVTIEALPSGHKKAITLPRRPSRSWKPDFKQVGKTLAGGISHLQHFRLSPHHLPTPNPSLQGGAGVGERWRGVLSLEKVVFGLVIVVYLITRLIGLTNFPIYFFTDEAIQTVQAADLIHNDFHNADRELFPTYFINGGQYNLSLSVYLQVIPYLIFGKSEVATRGTAVLSTLVGAICMGLILRDIFKQKYWWLGTLILSITPAWFLHSRTAFETALMVSMYAGFLYFYLRYRYLSPKNLYPALVFGALTFYAYSGGQMIMAVTGVLLLLSDIRYHWRNRKVGLIGIGVLVLLALPYLRFLIQHGAENYKHLQILGSYWTDPLSLSQKLHQFFSYYLGGLNPGYWFLPNNNDLARHLMKGYGHLLLITLPFALLGLGICLKNIRSSMHRLIMIALLAAPSAAALVGIGITRLLVFVIPADLLITLGVIACLRWLEKHPLPHPGCSQRREKVLTFGVLIPLVAFNFFMLKDALVNGPLWFSDYGLGGMQWGAKQIFPAVQDYLIQSPKTHIILSPAWANGTDVVARFFLPDSTPVELGSIEGYMFEHKSLDENTLFVMIPDEFKGMANSQKFTDIHIEKIMPYPDGTPGFYFLRLRYVDNIDAILATEQLVWSQLQPGFVTINGAQVSVKYSKLDMGSIQNAFDGDSNTLIRSFEANPLVIQLTFPQTQSMSGVTVRVGRVASRVTVQLQVEGQDTPVTFSQEVPSTPLPKDVILNFGTTLQVKFVQLEALSVNDTQPAHIHLWEVTFK